MSKRICKTCTAWSELVAQSIGDRPLEALCINPASPKVSRYTMGHETCMSWSTDQSLADYPSQRAPDAEDRSGRGPSLKDIAANGGPSIAEQLKEILGDKVEILHEGGAGVLLQHPPAEPDTVLERRREDGLVERIYTKRSMVSGLVRSMQLTAAADQWAALDRGVLIQNALPHLSDGQREFIKTGITDDEWDKTFPEEEEDLEDEGR